MSKFKIRHITTYTYEVPVRDSATQIMLYPIQDKFQEIVQHSIRISGDVPVNVHQDYYGNDVGTFTHSQPHSELIIDSRIVVQTNSRKLPAERNQSPELWEAFDPLRQQPAFIDFLKQEHVASLPEIREIVEKEKERKNFPLGAAKAFCSYVFKNFIYQKGITTVESTLDEIWDLRSGVCQDFAHILLVMLRQVNIPARYVSGYICPSKKGMRGEGATHAWVEAYMPDYGWVGLDPTNNCIVNDTHVRLAVGKNFSDCSPVKGTYRGISDHTLEVVVSVSYEDGHVSEDHVEMSSADTLTSFSKNSYRRHQEMQMQQ
jgi:transglutaminase-like putative cysteine protease